ncbi:MAG: hypothetical protein AAGI46_07580 [Planctomycetota bacterium]
MSDQRREQGEREDGTPQVFHRMLDVGKIVVVSNELGRTVRFVFGCITVVACIWLLIGGAVALWGEPAWLTLVRIIINVVVAIGMTWFIRWKISRTLKLASDRVADVKERFSDLVGGNGKEAGESNGNDPS